MRVRRFELRIIGIAIVVAWTAAAGLVLVAYRPGGPLDIVVGIAMALPIVIASLGVVWPPVARGAGAFPLMLGLGIGTLLLLLPSIGGILNQIQALGSQTLMPSLEAAYPWLLALAGTSLFSGFGVARRLQGGMALRRRRLVAGAAFAIVATLATGSLFAAVAIANELALRDRTDVPLASRFGPTHTTREPPPCDGPLATGRTAQVSMHLRGNVDQRPMGTVDLNGLRSGNDYRWLAYVASRREIGQYGAAANGDRAWLRSPAGGWRRAATTDVEEGTVDLLALQVALTDGYRATAEDHGIEVIEGARARRCRIAVDGATFQAAFPQVRWMVGDIDLRRWRGQLDYWIFLDGQLGQVAGTANGEGAGIEPDAMQATVDVLLTATERGRDVTIYPPAP